MKHTYLLVVVMAVVTYLIRMIPFVLFRRQIRSRFLRSFLYYIPYAVLTAMTIPAIFTSSADLWPSVIGFAVAMAAAFRKRSLLTVAVLACAAAYVTELVMGFLI